MVRIRLSTIIGAILLILWGLFLSVCVMLYVRYGSPQQLAFAIASQISQQTGVACRIGRASPTLLPVPHLQLRSVSIDVPRGRIYLPDTHLYLSWRTLLKGDVVLSRMVINQPVASLDLRPLDAHGELDETPAPPLGYDTVLPVVPEFLQDLRLSFTGGQLRLTTNLGEFDMSGCEGNLRLSGEQPGFAEVRIGSLLTDAPDLPSLQGNAVQLRLTAITPDQPLVRSFDSLALNGTFSVSDLAHDMRIAFNVRPQTKEPFLTGEFHCEGLLEGSPRIPLTLALPFDVGAYSVDVRNARLQLEDNATEVSGVLHLGEWEDSLTPLRHALGLDTHVADRNDLSFTGTAVVGSLSLPRWFAFGRDLPTGIEAALHALSGELDFVLTPKGLDVPRLEALLCGIPFSGNGSVPDWSKPEIRITAGSDVADANKVFPELIQAAPDPFVWVGPPPVGGGDGEGPDYDIHLTAKTIQAWKYEAQNFSIRITPHASGTRLTIDAGSFYDGTLHSVVDIDDDITLATTLKKVDTIKPVQILAGVETLRGTVNATSTLKADSQSFDHFLSSLSGTIEGEVRDGSLRSNESTIPFNSLKFTVKPKGAGIVNPPLPPELPFTGTWNVLLRTPHWEASANLTGSIILDSQTFTLKRLDDMPGKIQWSGNDIQANLTTRISLDVGKQALRLTSAKGTLNGGNVSGSLTGASLFETPDWQGTIAFSTMSLSKILAQHNLLPDGMPPTALQQGNISLDFQVDTGLFTLTNIKGRVDDTDFSGSIRKNEAEGPYWQVALKLGTCNVSRYLPETKLGGRAIDWSPHLLENIRARGLVTMDALMISKLIHRSLRIPFTWENNALSCSPITFIPYNGKGEAHLSLRGSPQGYRTRLRYTARDVDAALFCREAGLNAIVGGTVSLGADLAGLIIRGADIPSGLSGNWNITNRNGFMAERKADGSMDNPTSFNSISASGTIQSGVLKTQDIDLRSEQLNATGNGIIDLVRWTLYCRLSVSTRTFSNVTVTYSGSLDAPERSVDAMSAVAGTLSKIGNGIFGLMKDVLSAAPFQIFQR